VNARLEELLELPSPSSPKCAIAPEAPDQPVVYRKPSPRFILEMDFETRARPGAELDGR